MRISRQMIESRWGEFASLEQLDGKPLRDGRFSVLVDEGRFECLLAEKNTPYLFVLLSGARDPAKRPLPKFDRWSWAEDFPGTVLCISDPTFYLDSTDLHIAWYVGTSKHNWLQSMAKLVVHVAKKIGVATDRIISYGSSAGGFGALTLAAALGDATAVAINPQTDIRCYSRRFVNQFLKVGFDGRTIDQLTENQIARFSAITAFRRSPRAKCLLLQNVRDKVHFDKHYTPFCRAFDVTESGRDATGRVNVMTFDDPKGHMGVDSREMLPDLITRAVALTSLILNSCQVGTNNPRES